MRDVDPIERAFHVARSGEYRNVEAIRTALHQEGRNHGVIDGPTLRRQLRDLIAAAHRKTIPEHT